MSRALGYARQRFITEREGDEVKSIVANSHISDTSVISPFCLCPFSHVGEDDFIIMFGVRIYDVIRIPENIRENAVKPFITFCLFGIRGIFIPVSELLHQIADAYLIACQCVEKLSFLPFDLVLWCGCSAAILYHILGAMSRDLSIFFRKESTCAEGLYPTFLCLKWGAYRVLAPQVKFDRSFSWVYGGRIPSHTLRKQKRLRAIEERPPRISSGT